MVNINTSINPKLNPVKNSIDEKKAVKNYPKITTRISEEIQQAVVDISVEIGAKNSSEVVRRAITILDMLLKQNKLGNIPVILMGDEKVAIFE